MHEPATTITDFVLALQCGLFAVLLLRAEPAPEARRDWVLFFASLSLAALCGGVVHGYLPEQESLAHAALWRATLLAIGVTAFMAWRIGAGIALPSAPGRVVSGAAALLFGVYAWVVLLLDQSFRVAVLHYLPAVVFMMLCLALAARRRRGGGLAGAAGGLAITLAAAVLQQMRVGIHPVHFDHNALYHVIEMAALVLVYRGAGAAGGTSEGRRPGFW